jgi:hypothetical protein
MDIHRSFEMRTAEALRHLEDVLANRRHEPFPRTELLRVFLEAFKAGDRASLIAMLEKGYDLPTSTNISIAWLMEIAVKELKTTEQPQLEIKPDSRSYQILMKLKPEGQGGTTLEDLADLVHAFKIQVDEEMARLHRFGLVCTTTRVTKWCLSDLGVRYVDNLKEQIPVRA